MPADLPIRVRRGSARVCGREFVGEDLVVLFAYRGARWGLEVRGVAPTGPSGARLDLLRALVGLEPSEPDWVVLGPSTEAPGVRVVASGTWDGL